MQIVESIPIAGDRRIDLAHGDITRMPRREWVDALVVSAFPGDHTPTPGSLIGALHARGISVAKLARHKDVDHTDSHGAWLSRPFTTSDPGIGFDRIIGFEPARKGRPPETVGELFRALVPMLHARPFIRSVATPILASGDQGWSTTEMLQPLLDAALHWMRLGLPLDRLVIVSRSDRATHEARALFRSVAQDSPVLASTIGATGPWRPAPPALGGDIDVFISYSRKNTEDRILLVQALHAARPGLRVFVDEAQIDVGAAWQQQVFESIERSRVFVSLLTPDYLASRVCLEEYGLAWLLARERTSGFRLFPLFLASTRLPGYMLLRNHLDCRERDRSRFPDAAARIVAALPSTD